MIAIFMEVLLSIIILGSLFLQPGLFYNILDSKILLLDHLVGVLSEALSILIQVAPMDIIKGLREI